MANPSFSFSKRLATLALLCGCAVPFGAVAQGKLYRDTANIRIIKTVCDDRLFTKTEVPPAVQGGLTALADSLMNYAKERGEEMTGKATYTFLLTKDTSIIGVERLLGQFPSEAIFIEALQVYAAMWTPAMQNNHTVCAMVRLEVDIKRGKMTLAIGQQ